MKNKSVALLIAFIIPIVLTLAIDYFDVLQIMGRENRPKLKRFIPLETSERQTEGKGLAPIKGISFNDTMWHTIPDFSFDGHNGKTITQDLLKDKITVVDFFFTNCPTVCPKLSSQLQRVQREYFDDEDVQILSHTVDPDRDTVETLKDYADIYDADSTKWFFVTGTKKALYDQARYGYFVSATEGDAGPEDFVHTEKFVLIDKSGVIRGYYDGTEEADVNRLMFDIKILELEYPLKKRR